MAHLAGLCLALPFLAWLFSRFLVNFWLIFGCFFLPFWGLVLACLVLSFVGFSWPVLASLVLSFLGFSCLSWHCLKMKHVLFASVFTVFYACPHFLQ